MVDIPDLTKTEVAKELLDIRDMLYKTYAQTRRKKWFKLQRPSEQAMQEADWERKLKALRQAHTELTK